MQTSSVDLIPDFDPERDTPIITGGRVNAFKAVNGLDPNDPHQTTDLRTLIEIILSTL